MNANNLTPNVDELDELCVKIKKLIKAHKYSDGLVYIQLAMKSYPHSPVPHNLMGIILEKEGKHAIAMNHFRAACALDPSYLPAKYNLEHFGTFFSKGTCAYDLGDCPDDRAGNASKIIYDGQNIGHIVRRS